MSFRGSLAKSRPDNTYPDGSGACAVASATAGSPLLPRNTPNRTRRDNDPHFASKEQSVPTTRTRKTSARSSIRFTSIFSLLTVALIVTGWWQRNEFWYTAERGLGYAFGIIGASLMCLLLLYPLRKHWKPMRNALPVRYWFQIHMMFGILGPLFILFHSNFRLGSLNSNVALFCMLLVAGSGVIGRYVYRQIHQGLYGEKIRFTDLNEAFQKGKTRRLHDDTLIDAGMEERLTSIEQLLSNRALSLWRGWRAGRQIKALRRYSRKRLKSAITKAMTDDRPDVQRAHELRVAYASWTHGLGSLAKLSRYSVFAKLFSLWHVLHLPIFFMMLISAIVHVVVVHMY